MRRLLLADRVKGEGDSFLAPLIPALSRAFEVRFVSLGPGETLAQAIGWADIVWLEWCWDHAVWATGSGVLAGRPCVVRLHSIEALQTDFPARMDWSAVSCLVTVGDDIAAVLSERFPQIQAASVPLHVVPNGIDTARFAPGTLTVENGQAFTNFAKDNQRYECNTRRSDGTLVFYEPKPNYNGADSITLNVIYPGGFAQTRHYSIEVK